MLDRTWFITAFTLVSTCGMAVSSIQAVAAPPDPAPPRAASSLDDEDRPKIRPAVHHVAPTEHQRDMARLMGELQRLRAEASMCRDIAAGKLSAVAAPPGR